MPWCVCPLCTVLCGVCCALCVVVCGAYLHTRTYLCVPTCAYLLTRAYLCGGAWCGGAWCACSACTGGAVEGPYTERGKGDGLLSVLHRALLGGLGGGRPAGVLALHTRRLGGLLLGLLDSHSTALVDEPLTGRGVDIFDLTGALAYRVLDLHLVRLSAGWGSGVRVREAARERRAEPLATPPCVALRAP